MRAFRYEFLDPDTVLAQGAQPYCDTRARVGLSDGTPDVFRGYTASLLATPGYNFVGASVRQPTGGLHVDPNDRRLGRGRRLRSE